MAKLYRPDEIEAAAAHLRRGELVAFPTETVYGLGAGLFFPEALLQIFAVKRRPPDNPLIVHIASVEEVETLAAHSPPDLERLAKAFWPGPLTLIVERRSGLPEAIAPGLPTIALRVPRHPLALALIRAAGMPIAAPSANLSGRPSATRAEHVQADLGTEIAAIIDGGATEVGLESTVLSLLDPERPQLARPGAVSQEAIEAVLGRPIAALQTGSRPISPGLKYRHYAPQAPLHLWESWEALAGRELSGCLLLSADPPPIALPPHTVHYLLARQNLYHLLRLADERGYREVHLIGSASLREDAALMDRVVRAAQHPT